MTNFCKDCKHIILSDINPKALNIAKCRNAPNGMPSEWYVSGEGETDYEWCTVNRVSTLHWKCGPEGRFFQMADRLQEEDGEECAERR